MKGDSVFRRYTKVYVGLMLLLATTVAASFVHLGVLNPILSFTIAVAKAVLVLLYFMHLRESPKVVWVWAAAGVFWLLIALVLMSADYLMRISIRLPQ